MWLEFLFLYRINNYFRLLARINYVRLLMWMMLVMAMAVMLVVVRRCRCRGKLRGVGAFSRFPTPRCASCRATSLIRRRMATIKRSTACLFGVHTPGIR